ncbi:MAG: tetratricopeptide repeat protein [Candidatus Abyssubacteria bacterium]|nr:tetratricopeptide repeat protein [Candidatus Abyssubacteria bacterium]
MIKVALFVVAIALSGFLGCAPSKNLQGSRVPGIDILKSSENVRTYNSGYDATFRAVVDALRQIDDSSAKLVKHSQGIVVFKKPDGAGAVTVRVKKIDERSTRVEISAKTRRKFLVRGGDQQTRDAFFVQLDELLGVTAPREIMDQPGESKEAARTLSGKTAEPDKSPLINRLRDELQLEEDKSFLERLSYDELLLLDRRLRALHLASAQKEELAGKCAACYIDLARLYHDSGSYGRSAEALKIALGIDPDNAVAHCNLGEIYKHLGLFEKALDELLEAKRLNPELSDTYINLGIIYDDHIIDDGKALENYKKYLELGGDDERVLDWIGAIEKKA